MVTMNSAQIFSMALGLVRPWKISDIKFNNEGSAKELHIHIDFDRGAKFNDEHGNACTVHDTVDKTWRHLNFFEHQCYLHCRVPRIETKDGKVHLIDVPWARKNIGFSLMFEAYVMSLIENEMPVNKAGKLLGEDAHRLWTIFNFWIKRAIDADQPEQVINLGVDETSSKRGHRYVTIGVDLDKRRVLHVTEGKGKSTINSIKQYFESKGMDPEKVKNACIDLSPSFIAGLKEYFPNTEIHFDKFHVVQLLNRAMDQVRILERKEHNELKGTKYAFLKRNANLTDQRQQEIENLTMLFPTLGEAYRLKELFFDLWEMNTTDEAEAFLEHWCADVEKLNSNPFLEFVKTVKAHKTGILNYIGSKISNGILEGINCKIQLAKRRARGYRDIENYMNMIYFLCGKLKFNYNCCYPLTSS
jgi:transposase